MRLRKTKLLYCLTVPKPKLKFLYAVFALNVIASTAFGAVLAWDSHTKGQGRAFYATLSCDFMPLTPPRTFDCELPFEEIEDEIEEPFVPFVDFDAKRAVMPNIVGWIQSYGTAINYPIVRGSDNDFYITHLADGTRNQMGAIFLDYRNAADFSDAGIVIYGHDMRTGDKFGSLRHYAQQDFFDAHSTMFIFTPTRNYLLKIFAGYIIDSSVEIPPTRFTDEDDFDEFISRAKRRSIFRSDAEPTFDDRLVFLATCVSAGHKNDRLIIAGILAEL